MKAQSGDQEENYDMYDEIELPFDGFVNVNEIIRRRRQLRSQALNNCPSGGQDNSRSGED